MLFVRLWPASLLPSDPILVPGLPEDGFLRPPGSVGLVPDAHWQNIKRIINDIFLSSLKARGLRCMYYNATFPNVEDNLDIFL